MLSDVETVTSQGIRGTPFEATDDDVRVSHHLLTRQTAPVLASDKTREGEREDNALCFAWCLHDEQASLPQYDGKYITRSRRLAVRTVHSNVATKDNATFLKAVGVSPGSCYLQAGLR